MKRFAICLLLCITSLIVYAQTKLLVDAIHGADYTLSDIYQPVDIDFSAIFPDYEIHYLNKDNLPITHTLIQETQEGNQTLNYSINLPDTLVSMYVKVNYLENDTDDSYYGHIADAQGQIISTMFQGHIHADSLSGNNYTVSITLASDREAQIIIGYGTGLFKSAETPYNLLNLNEYDLVLRINDRTYFALIGRPPAYSYIDNIALAEGFNQGLRFFNILNFEPSQVDKPFVHFYSDKDMTVDFQVNLPGRLTYGVPLPKVNQETVSWQNHSVKVNAENEIVYEGALKSLMNFLHFNINNNLVSVKNKISNDIFDLYLIRYHQHQLQYTFIPTILAKQTIDTQLWNNISTNDLITLIKNEWFATAKQLGMTDTECHQLVNQYPWVEDLIFRAYQKEDDLFGLYRISQETYDRLLPYKCQPAPEKDLRLLWIMLSNITNLPERDTIDLQERQYQSEIKNGFKLHEYGVADEFYQTSTRDNSFFGVNPSEWNWTNNGSPIPYANYISETAFNDITTLDLFEDFYILSVADPINNGISRFSDFSTDSPFVVAQIVEDHGGLIMSGTSAFFRNDADNWQFLRNCASALINSSFFPNHTNPDIVKPEKLSISSYPNPFNAQCKLSFNLPEQSPVQIKIFNIKGQLVYQSEETIYPKGKHSVNWTSQDTSQQRISSGIYFYQIKTPTQTLTKKMLFIK